MGSQSETEKELRIAASLMMFFFFTQAGIEYAQALKWIPADSMTQSLSMAHDAWLLFFGMVSGIFRGMVPAASRVIPPGMGGTLTQETRIVADAPVPPVTPAPAPASEVK